MPARLPRSTTAFAAVTGLIASGLAALVFAPAAQADPAQPTPDCSAATTCTVTYGFTGEPQTFDVPEGVTSLNTLVVGASGGTSPRSGRGGATTATLDVTNIASLTVSVGQVGAVGDTVGTYGGGGAVGTGSEASSGGGGSTLSTGSTLLLAAGGGGGVAGPGASAGGNGGGTTGGGGSNPPFPSYTYTGATGGTPSAGGGGGTAQFSSIIFAPGQDGSVGQGGTGSNQANQPTNGGGGGGGGYFGGGGGSYLQGGGGGSGYVAPDLTGSTTSGVSSGNGTVVFIYDKFATTTTLSASPISGAVDGDTVILSATVSSDKGTPDGTIAFRNGTTAILGCGDVSVGSDAKATCTTTFPAGAQNLTATYSGDTSFAGSTGSLSYDVASKPTVSTPTLEGGTVDAAYSQQLSAAGGTGNYSYALAGDTSLPAGLSLSTAGVISGTPTAAGTTNFTVRVTDSASTPRHTDKALSITVGKASQSLTVTSNPPSSGVVDGRHEFTVTGGKSSAKVSIGLGKSTTNSACALGVVRTSTPVSEGVQTANATIYFNRVGTCSIELKQDGDSNYEAAATTPDVTINVTGKPTTTTLALSADQVVHGQPVTATATVTGGAGGTVYFYVDDSYYGSADVENGAATSGNLAATKPEMNGKRQVQGGAGRSYGLAVGSHTVTASFSPSDSSAFTSSETADGSSLTVNPSKTTTTVKVNAKTLVATVSVNAPSQDVPTGSVTFLVDGKEVGSAEIVDGVATLDYTAPTGKAVSALYSGREDGSENTEVSESSASTARANPTVTATVSSSKPASKAGWYAAPVTVQYTCVAGSDTVTCPSPVTVSSDGVTTVSKTVMAEDGGVATVTVTVKVDRTRPTVTVSGVKNGRVYPTLPKIGCRASDRTSGIAGCVLTRTVGGGTTVTFVATATDRAGNTARKTVTVRRSPVLITGADYRGALPVVKLGKGYTLVYTGKGKPSYVYAAPTSVKPKGNGGPFTKIGKNRWAYSVVFTKNLRGHSTWSFGVMVGKKTLVVRVKIKK